ncbi:MAG: glycoside hydrolase family 36 protein [Christensenellales bacterium]
MENLRIRITYEQDDNVYITGVSNNDLQIDVNCDDGRIVMKVSALKKLSLLECAMSYEYAFNTSDKIFCNGYQSWTTSMEVSVFHKEKGLLGLGKHFPFKKFTALSGDYGFHKYTNLSGLFHGYSYGYVRNNDEYYLVGSLNEKNAFTIVGFEPYRNRIKLSKDVEGITLDKGDVFEGIDVVVLSGGYDDVFDRYFGMLSLSAPRVDKLSGYTSWYNYFGKITEQQLLRDLENISIYGDKIDIFQIDDGYQSATGDWLSVKERKFPHGMKYLADAIHSKGMKAGLWLAPTLAARNSKVVKEHRDWLLTAPDGKPVLGGVAWGGAYVLDIEKQQVRDYLKGVFDVIVNQWGYDMVKLDFLYSSCIIPRNNKTRGRIMYETMEFLRECVGDKLILGCGMPLASGWGLVDMCRTGCDVDLSFKPKFYTKCTNQEIVCTKNSIYNTLFRRHLDGRAFALDPDVFFARKSNLKFNDEQREILATVNALAGSVRLVSDDVGEYDEKGKELFEKTIGLSGARIISCDKAGNNVIIRYTHNEEEKVFCFDIEKGKIVGIR